MRTLHNVKTPTKSVLVGLGIGALLFVVFLAAFFRAAKGFKASEQDPRKLYAFYVQKQIPPSVRIHGAFGGFTPIDGTQISFKFEIGQKDLEELISSKHLQTTNAAPWDLFPTADLEAMKTPEFYLSDSDTTWRQQASRVRMAVDRASGIVLYVVTTM